MCYQYGGTTALTVNTNPNEIEGVYASCLECAIDTSSSSSEGYSESSESSLGYSESSSSSMD